MSRRQKDTEIRQRDTEQLSPAQQQQMKEYFRLFDKDNDGLISLQDLRTTFRSLNMSYSDAQVETIFTAADIKHDNVIDYDEFMSMFAGVDVDAKEKEMRSAFDYLDADHSGFLSVNEVLQGMKSMGIELTREEVVAMIAEVDTHGHQEVDFIEFKRLISLGQTLQKDELDASTS